MATKKQITSVSDDVESRLREGEKLGIDQLMHEYYPGLHKLEAETKMRGHISTARYRLAKDGIPVCPVGRKVFGVPTTKTEYEYGQQWYARQIKGLFNHAVLLHAYAKRKNLVPMGFRQEKLMLPTFAK